MNCVSCNTDNDYNRVAVDRPSGEIIGTICVRCEEKTVSKFHDSDAPTMASCSICGEDSDTIFPEWDSIIENHDGPCELEYTIELTTPAVCEDCLDANRLSPLVQPIEETD